MTSRQSGPASGRSASHHRPGRKLTDPFYLSPEWEQLRRQALRAAHWRCSDCGKLARGAKHDEPRPIVDHIVPRKKGGSDALHNLRVLCLPCHNRKTAWVDLNQRPEIAIDGLPDDWR